MFISELNIMAENKYIFNDERKFNNKTLTEKNTSIMYNIVIDLYVGRND